VRKKDKFWDKIPFLWIILPIFCFIVGTILIFIALYLMDFVNRTLGTIVVIIATFFIFLGFVLPFIFIGRSFVTSVKDATSKNILYKFSGIIGLVFLIIYIVTYREYITGFLPMLPVMLLILLIFGGVIFVLISIIYLIYRLIKWIYKYLLKR